MAGSSYYTTTHWQRLRATALRRDKWQCRECGVQCGKGGVRPYVDHIKPRPRQQDHPTQLDVLDNLQVLCGVCHNRKTRWQDNGVERPTINANGYPAGSEWDS